VRSAHLGARQGAEADAGAPSRLATWNAEGFIPAGRSACDRWRPSSAQTAFLGGQNRQKCLILLVGAGRFELPTPSPPG
jgi:hypothetical protein